MKFIKLQSASLLWSHVIAVVSWQFAR